MIAQGGNHRTADRGYVQFKGAQRQGGAVSGRGSGKVVLPEISALIAINGGPLRLRKLDILAGSYLPLFRGGKGS